MIKLLGMEDNAGYVLKMRGTQHDRNIREYLID